MLSRCSKVYREDLCSLKEKIPVSNKKRKYKDDLLNDDLEDEEMLILLGAKTRRRSRRMNNVKVNIFLSTLNRWYNTSYFNNANRLSS